MAWVIRNSVLTVAHQAIPLTLSPIVGFNCQKALASLAGCCLAFVASCHPGLSYPYCGLTTQ